MSRKTEKEALAQEMLEIEKRKQKLRLKSSIMKGFTYFVIAVLIIFTLANLLAGLFYR